MCLPLSGYILLGLDGGFKEGFEYSHWLRSATQNMPSAQDHPEVVERYLDKETILGPFQPGVIYSLHISQIGMIPKGHYSGKWTDHRPILPFLGASVNDGIDPALCTLHYMSVETVAKATHRVGRGALLVKADIKSAYRLVSVHPDYHSLLGIDGRASIPWKGISH